MLSRNVLKIIGLISMTLDHIGVALFPDVELLRILGRIAFPVFAFMIGEGCRYTKNKKKYLGTMAFVAILCQVVYFFALKSLYQCILVTFSISVIINYSISNAMKKKSVISYIMVFLLLAGAYFITEILPEKLVNTDFNVDYGFYGVLVPVFVYLAESKKEKIVAVTLGLILLALNSSDVQWYSLFAVLLLLMYNGNRGKYNIKYLFYIYYPLHLVLIYGIGFLI